LGDGADFALPGQSISAIDSITTPAPCRPE
jgi:hypothetical protein